MGFGTKLKKGTLPAYSVGTEEEARRLLMTTCPTNMKGDYIAPELASEQTLDNLKRFTERLDRGHEVLTQNGQCQCI